MIFWIFHLLPRIFWNDALRWTIADLIRLALAATRRSRGTAGSPIASVLANPMTMPSARLVTSLDEGSSTGIWSLETLIRYRHLPFGWR